MLLVFGPVLPDGEIHPQFFENWENLSKFEDVGNTLGTEK